jgi:hypothetical protein
MGGEADKAERQQRGQDAAKDALWDANRDREHHGCSHSLLIEGTKVTGTLRRLV